MMLQWGNTQNYTTLKHGEKCERTSLHPSLFVPIAWAWALSLPPVLRITSDPIGVTFHYSMIPKTCKAYANRVTIQLRQGKNISDTR